MTITITAVKHTLSQQVLSELEFSLFSPFAVEFSEAATFLFGAGYEILLRHLSMYSSRAFILNKDTFRKLILIRITM